MVVVCDRTPQVRGGIVRAAGAASCEAVTASTLAEIRVLDLSGSLVGPASTDITELRPGDFYGLTGLEELHLEGNQLESLPANIFLSLTSLRELWLYVNQLAELPDGVFSSLTSLELLQLGGNRFRSVPKEVFSDLPRLKSLGLSSNPLAELPEGYFSASLGWKRCTSKMLG